MRLITKRIVLARDIGIHGNLFGGTLMAWIDEAAAALATEYCHIPNMVTLRVGEMLLKKNLCKQDITCGYMAKSLQWALLPSPYPWKPESIVCIAVRKRWYAAPISHSFVSMMMGHLRQ